MPRLVRPGGHDVLRQPALTAVGLVANPEKTIRRLEHQEPLPGTNDLACGLGGPGPRAERVAGVPGGDQRPRLARWDAAHVLDDFELRHQGSKSIVARSAGRAPASWGTRDGGHSPSTGDPGGRCQARSRQRRCRARTSEAHRAPTPAAPGVFDGHLATIAQVEDEERDLARVDVQQLRRRQRARPQLPGVRARLESCGGTVFKSRMATPRRNRPTRSTRSESSRLKAPSSRTWRTGCSKNSVWRSRARGRRPVKGPARRWQGRGPSWAAPGGRPARRRAGSGTSAGRRRRDSGR